MNRPKMRRAMTGLRVGNEVDHGVCNRGGQGVGVNEGTRTFIMNAEVESPPGPVLLRTTKNRVFLCGAGRTSNCRHELLDIAGISPSEVTNARSHLAPFALVRVEQGWAGLTA